MNKVMNSVLQIRDECNKMFDMINGVDYVNLTLAKARLEEALNKLLLAYDETPDDYASLKQNKAKTNAIALELEYYIQAYLGQLKERYKLRGFIKQFYTDISQAFHTVSKIEKEDVILWASYYKYAVVLNDRSKHILLSLDKDDEEMIRIITMALADLKKRLPNLF